MHKIEHIVAEPHNPQTQGKVERLDPKRSATSF